MYRKLYADVARFDKGNERQKQVCLILCRLLNERGVPYRMRGFKHFIRITTPQTFWSAANLALEAAMMHVIEGGK